MTINLEDKEVLEFIGYVRRFIESADSRFNRIEDGMKMTAGRQEHCLESIISIKEKMEEAVGRETKKLNTKIALISGTLSVIVGIALLFLRHLLNV